MSDLISKSVLLAELDKWINPYPTDDTAQFLNGLATAISCVEEAPTVDAAPVVHGQWVLDTEPDDGDCRCSNCLIAITALHKKNHAILKALGYTLSNFYKYCPNCGSKMDL